MAYLDNDGVLYLWSKIKAAFAGKGDAISSITRSGTTFTATKADGTSFTFTQQDNTVAKTTTTPKANGTAAVGSETKYAAGDHVHPTDTTRAAAADLTSHTGNTTVHITASERSSWNAKTSNTGTVTKVSTGIGLTGGDITASGTVKAKLKSETAHTASSATPTNTSGRQYAVGTDKDGYLSVNVPWEDTKALGSMTGTLEVANGGTGATTASGALTNLGAAAASHSHSADDISSGTLSADRIPSLNASKIGAGTLGVARGGTGAATLGAGVVYHSASGTGALSIATAANLVSAIGTTAVNRATADASGNNISDTYAKKTDIASMYKYKGSVASAGDLPTTGQVTGDVYNIESSSTYGAAGANVAWNGTAWDSLGEIFSIAAITNAQLDEICV